MSCCDSCCGGGSGGCARASDVEAHVEDVALGDDVVLALEALLAAAGGLGATSPPRRGRYTRSPRTG